MAPHSSILAWKIPWTEEPGRLQSMGSRRVGHDWTTSLLSYIGEGNGNPLQCSCLENPRDGGAWWAAVSGVAQSQTRLKRLSSSSRAVFYSHLGLSDIFFMISLRLCTTGEDTTEAMYSFHCIISKKLVSTWFVTGDPNHSYLLTVRSAWILHCKIMSFPFP